MKTKLTLPQYMAVASMLFGLFFGAGNLIFPVYLGQMAGRRLIPAIAGFCVTGVGLPLLGVVSLGVSRCSGLAHMSSRVSRRYGTFFTCLLYLTIGPFFAIPRCATVPFSVGIEPILMEPYLHTGKAALGSRIPLAVFSLLFFGIVLWFSLRPNGILTWIGKILNPVFLALLSILMIAALSRPMGQAALIAPDPSYQSGAFFNGFLEGYNTMDALAGLAFGIIVVNVIRSLGVKDPGAIARCTVKAGLLSTVLMAVIYLMVALAGVQSRGVYEINSNGGITLALIARHYFGAAGSSILALTITFACLKTSIGLITSCGETFSLLFPGLLSYRSWAVLFCGISLLIANRGLEAIITYSLPVLMFLYPLAITLILLSLLGKFFGNDQIVYQWTTGFTLAAAFLDFLKALPEFLKGLLHVNTLLDAAGRVLPFSSIGLGWICPAVLGFLIGILLKRGRRIQEDKDSQHSI